MVAICQEKINLCTSNLYQIIKSSYEKNRYPDGFGIGMNYSDQAYAIPVQAGLWCGSEMPINAHTLLQEVHYS